MYMIENLDHDNLHVTVLAFSSSLLIIAAFTKNSMLRFSEGEA